MSEDQRLIETARAHGYEYPSLPCSECGEPVYFVPGDMPQDSGHWVYHNHGEDRPMTTVYRMDKDTGKVSPIERWKAEARLVGNYRDEKEALRAATKDAPVETIGAYYWTEEDSP